MIENQLRKPSSGGSQADAMDLKLTWGDLARACGGTLALGCADDLVSSLATDSRKIEPGQAYWALKGAKLDGHDFLEQTAARASGWIVARGTPLPSRIAPHVVEVLDTLKALHALAAFHRKRFDIPIAGITGSNGKTTTKELLRAICMVEGPVCATTGNLNNHFGLPLSILQLKEDHRYGVFEMGASKKGDIIELAQIARPTVGILTNIGPAHLEFFGSMEGVFKTKSELIDGMQEGGPVAINLDDSWLASLETALGSRAITYGVSERAQVRLIDEDGPNLDLVIARHKISVPFHAPGRIHRLNAVAAAAGAFGMGLSPATIGEGLSAFRPAAMRFEPRKHSSGAWFVVDAYNANPASMKAGIESFIGCYPKGKRYVVLGDMKELGEGSTAFHRELGEWLAGQKIDGVFLAGEDMSHAASALKGSKPEAVYEKSPLELIPAIRPRLTPDAAVYFKASRAMEFERLVQDL